MGADGQDIRSNGCFTIVFFLSIKSQGMTLGYVTIIKTNSFIKVFEKF